MIFSKQSVETAYNYIGVYYDKILSVDLTHNIFFPVKVEDSEWNGLPHQISFTDWVKRFIFSDDFRPYGENRNLEEFEQYYNLDNLRSLRAPLICRYEKKIKGEYHDVEMIFMPIGPMSAYLFVRDNSKMSEMRSYIE